MFEGRFSRRRFLASAGVTVTLPMLPSLLWSRRGAAATCDAPRRFIVYYYSNGNNIFPGVVDEIGLYNRVLTPKQIADLASGSCR